uniref:Uncharacterized protein n=1 Tax=Arundo donax TaxID=35708 RepID=A0A0A9CFL8_ARUDO
MCVREKRVHVLRSSIYG